MAYHDHMHTSSAKHQLKNKKKQRQYLIKFYGCRVGVIKLEGDTMHCCYHQWLSHLKMTITSDSGFSQWKSRNDNLDIIINQKMTKNNNEPALW
jgi:hypothetical protein